jgi:uncharacterized hydrophobic protein (TIGR00271 family)
MRPLTVQVSTGKGKKLLEKAKQLEGKNLALVKGSDGEREVDIMYGTFSNNKVGDYISEISKFEEVKITLFPQGVMAMYPPNDQAPEQVTDIEPRSAIEIFLAGLQSIGSWKGFIGYSVITSFIVWIGLFTNTSYLLVAAMLIAPFAGPAMNTAIATARGDWLLLRQGMLRYFISIGITIAGTCLLSLIFQQQIATPLMVETSQLSFAALLLALSAGAAGALNIVQSERDSLVSGAAVGMLVAASLAPPAGIVGMTIAIGKWEMVTSGVFLLFLQLIGINLTGSLVFRMFGLNSEGPRYGRGRKTIFSISFLTTVVLAVFLLYLQLYQSPDMQRSSRAQRAAAEIHNIVEDNMNVDLIEASVRFTRADIIGQNSLLCVVYVQVKPDAKNESREAIRQNLVREIQKGLLEKEFKVTPLVDVIVMDPP